MHRCASGCGASSCWRSTARAGRPTRLRAYQRARTTLADELGIEPGSALRELESAILDQDDLRLRRRRGRGPTGRRDPGRTRCRGERVGRSCGRGRAAGGDVGRDRRRPRRTRLGHRARGHRQDAPRRRAREHGQRRPTRSSATPAATPRIARRGRVVRPGAALGRQLLDAGPVRRAPRRVTGHEHRASSRRMGGRHAGAARARRSPRSRCRSAGSRLRGRDGRGRRADPRRRDLPDRTARHERPRLGWPPDRALGHRPLGSRGDLARCTAPIGRPRTSTAYTSRAAASRSPCTKRRRRGYAAHRRDE